MQKRGEEDFLKYIQKQQQTRNRYCSEAQLYHGGLGSLILTFPRLSCSMVLIYYSFPFFIYFIYHIKKKYIFILISSGRAAMVGFFMAYFVDALTRIDMVGQTGNFICKAGILATVLGILLFRKRQDFGNLRKLADEATFYDRQWQHQDSSTSTTTSKQGRTWQPKKYFWKFSLVSNYINSKFFFFFLIWWIFVNYKFKMIGNKNYDVTNYIYKYVYVDLICRGFCLFYLISI